MSMDIEIETNLASTHTDNDLSSRICGYFKTSAYASTADAKKMIRHLGEIVVKALDISAILLFNRVRKPIS